MNESNFTIITNIQKFSMTIINKKTYYYIKLNNLKDVKNPCIEIFLRINDNKYVKTAKLQQINYNTTCNLTNNMEKGIGTIDMIHATFATIAYIFKDITEIEFEDCSQIPCDKTTPSLKHYYVAFKEQTWYEYHFGAIPSSKYYIQYQDMLKQFNDKKSKKDNLWFQEDIIPLINIDNNYEYDNISINKLKELYEKSTTYKHFFDSLKKYHPNICMPQYDWIEKFFLKSELHIPLKNT